MAHERRLPLHMMSGAGKQPLLSKPPGFGPDPLHAGLA